MTQLRDADDSPGDAAFPFVGESDYRVPAPLDSIRSSCARRSVLDPKRTQRMAAMRKPNQSIAGGNGSRHGLNTPTSAFANSVVSRETTIRPWCCAVAAMIRSGCEKV